MSHLKDDVLILYFYGESDDAASVERHLSTCARCRGELEAIERDLDNVGAIPAPERSADYGAQVWRAIAPRLRRRRSRTMWLVAAAALLLAVTFIAGRLSMQWDQWAPPERVRERIFLVALGQHLDRSEVLLLEVVNADDERRGREAARELLHESRLYRQTAYRVGDVASGQFLDELERLLLDVAHGTTPSDALKVRIADRDVLFKIRVLQTTVRAREERLVPQRF